MTAARFSVLGLLGAVLVALAALACDESIEIPNRAPSAAFDSIEADGEVVEVYYRLLDLDGDDVDIALTACRGSDCLAPTAAPGGDGLTALPTETDMPVLHLFRWAVGCDAIGSDRTTEIVLRIVPDDGEDLGASVQSDPFTLESIGVTEGCTPLE